MKTVITFFFALIILSPWALALSAPNVTFIPSRFSKDASFIAIAKGASNNPLRIGWIVPPFSGYYGAFPKIGDDFICYFSNTDPSANCGPTPFTFSTVGVDPYTLFLDSIDHRGETTNTSLSVEVGGITLTSLLTENNHTVSIIVQPFGDLPDTVTFAVYQSNFSSYTNGYLPLKRDPDTGYWRGNITLPGGDYFLAFTASSPIDFGGNLFRISVPLLPEETLCTPGEGGYPLETDSVRLLGILLSEDQRSVISGVNGIPFTITNPTSRNFSALKATLPSDLSPFVTVSLTSTTLSPNDTTSFTVILDHIQASMTINTLATLTVGTETVGQIPLYIPVTITGGSTSCPVGGGALTIQPPFWSGSFELGSPATKTFTITNNKDSTISGFEYSASGVLDKITTVSLPSTIAPLGSGTLEVSLQPVTSGDYQGFLTITTKDGSEKVFIDIAFREDLSSDLEELKRDFEEKKTALSSSQLVAVSDIIADIDVALSNAENQAAAGNYEEAVQSSTEARAKIETLITLSTFTPPEIGGGGFDPTIILGLLVVVGIGIGGFLFIKKRRGGGGDVEEELEEELKESA